MTLLPMKKYSWKGGGLALVLTLCQRLCRPVVLPGLMLTGLRGKTRPRAQLGQDPAVSMAQGQSWLYGREIVRLGSHWVGSYAIKNQRKARGAFP